MLHISAATLSHVLVASTTLREADLREMQALRGELCDVYETLEESLDISRYAFAIHNDSSRLVGLFGVAPLPALGHGAIWMVATPAIEDHSREFLRRCRAWVQAFHQEFPTLTNIVDARNHKHLRWIGWCGFTITGAYPVGPTGHTFLEFRRRRGDAPHV